MSQRKHQMIGSVIWCFFTLYLSKMFLLQFCKNYFSVNSFCSVSDFLLGLEDCLVDAIHSGEFII